MQVFITSPKKALNKAYLKEKVSREDIEKFKFNFSKMMSRLKEDEYEEHLKNIVADFLKDTWYKDKYEINTKDRSDLVIHIGKTNSDSVGVIIEAKKGKNKTEMFSEDKPNSKSLHELTLYYLRERTEYSNIDLKHLVITNFWDWYILDEDWFEKYVYRNAKLRKDFENWKNSGKDTRFFYESIAKPFYDSLEEALPCTYINLHEIANKIDPANNSKDDRLIPFYKFFSPAHLLKQSFKNDSNTLDKDFYQELLHIIGLEESSPESGKKTVITRMAEPLEGTLLENTINKLRRSGRWKNISDLSTFGATEDEQLYHVALELSITWINRIIFLKLLEAQLFEYHKNNEEYLFLNTRKVFDFVQLNNLFFDILAEKDDRPSELLQYFSNVPYLNSSLFDRTQLEINSIDIAALDNRVDLPLFKDSVLKNEKQSPHKVTYTLDYLLRFLDAYDFSSVNAEGIQEKNKSLINASVLGLIFEKLNGYKHGAFFTPGFVTMFISREAIRKAIISKFNKKYLIDCGNFDELKNFLSRRFKPADILEYNQVVNELKICDPAVGSGHFLVSALNEILSIKSELGILADSAGLLLTGYEIKTENDELIITYNDNTEIFKYSVNNGRIDPKIQRVQKTLFHEKELLIENCLFGVDIESNSVKICRLRLWIELLKSAYYTEESGLLHLETLPNIDINIQCGNSLINRFELEDDLQQGFRNARLTVSDYKEAVGEYKQTKDKRRKDKILEIIKNIKGGFTFSLDDNFKKKISKARGKVTNFESEINRKTQWNEEISPLLLQKLKKATLELKVAESRKDDILSNAIYRHSFEWRFEFPEVLDDQANYIGFDVVIGNPPYIPLEDFSQPERDYFRDRYRLFERKFETSVLFISAGLEIASKRGILAFIAPVTWQTGENYSLFRKFLVEAGWLYKIVNLPFNVFPGAYVDTAIYFFEKKQTPTYDIYSFKKKDVIKSLENIKYTSIGKNLMLAPKFKIILNPFAYKILQQSDLPLIQLGDITKSTQGLAGSQFGKTDNPNMETAYPFLSKGNVYNYHLHIEETYFTNLDNNHSLEQFYKAEPKILIRRIINRQDRLSVAYTERRMVFKKDINPFIVTDPRFKPKYLLAYMASKLISYFYLNISSIAGKDDFRQTTLGELREIPVPLLSNDRQEQIEKIVNCIILLAQHSKDYSFFERLIDSLLYEIYFKEQIVAAECQIREYLIELPDVDPFGGDADLKQVELLYKSLSSPQNIISTRLLKLLNIHEINIIEGRIQ